MTEAAAAAKKKLMQERYYRYNSARVLAKDSYRRGNYEEAVRFYTEAMEFAEEDCVLPLILARSKAHCERGDHAAAREDALRLIEAAPDDVNVIANDAYTLFHMDEFGDAMVRHVIGYEMRKKPDTFDVGQKVCKATMKTCMGEVAGPVMNQERLGKTIVSMSMKSKPLSLLDVEQKQALCKRTKATRDRFLAEKYLRGTAADKEFLKSCLTIPTVDGANKQTAKELLAIIREALKVIDMKQETLMARCPMYYWKNQEPILTTKRENEIKEEKNRFKTGAVSVILKLNNELNTAYEADDINKCFSLAFRLERYILSHCKHFLTETESQRFLDALYNVIGEFYLSTKRLHGDLNADKNDQRIYCMLGADVPDTPFFHDIRRSLMPHVVEKRKYRTDVERRLEVAVPCLERAFLYHELAMCMSAAKEAETSMKAAQKGYSYAKSIDHNVWCTNNEFLVARANYLQGDLEDAREVLASALTRAAEEERTTCVKFLEKVIDVIKREESQNFDLESPTAKYQRQIIKMMPNMELKLQAENLFRKMDSLPVAQRFRMKPKTDETQGNAKTSKKLIRLVTPLKRRTLNSIKDTNACEEKPYTDARATFVV